MKRVSDPQVRRKQILDTAMKLFCEKGYDATSLEDIARELQVVKSLCYRYFDCKQTLYGAVLEEYTEESCRGLAETIHNRSKSMSERLQSVLAQLLKPAAEGRWHEFFHKKGNESVHEQLAARMCKYLLPHLIAELEPDGCADVHVLAQFMLSGLMGIWQGDAAAPETAVSQFGELAQRLLRGRSLPVSPDGAERLDA
jgi:AcrR family transcriptional regulator